MEDQQAIIWGVLNSAANVACAPLERALLIRQVRKQNGSVGWKPAAWNYMEKEGLLSGWRGYIARGVSSLILEFFNGGFQDIKYDNYTSLFWTTMVTTLVTTPLRAIEVHRMSDVGEPLSHKRIRDEKARHEGEEPQESDRYQLYDNYFDAASHIYNTKGLLGFYDGYTANLLKSVVWDFNFILWVQITSAFSGDDFVDTLLSFGYMASSQLINYPLQLLMNRMILDLEKKQYGLLDRIQSILAEEGILGFYEGFASYDHICQSWGETAVSTGLALTLSAVAIIFLGAARE